MFILQVTTNYGEPKISSFWVREEMTSPSYKVSVAPKKEGDKSHTRLKIHVTTNMRHQTEKNNWEIESIMQI